MPLQQSWITRTTAALRFLFYWLKLYPFHEIVRLEDANKHITATFQPLQHAIQVAVNYSTT